MKLNYFALKPWCLKSWIEKFNILLKSAGHEVNLSAAGGKNKTKQNKTKKT